VTSSKDLLGARALPPRTAPPLDTGPPIENGQRSTRSKRSRSVSAIGRWLAVYWKPLTMLVACRLVLLGVLWASRYVSHVVGGPTLGHRFDRLEAWDGGWYVHAAHYGWPHAVPTSHGHLAYSTLAFFPAFPLAIRAVAVTGVTYLFAGVLAALFFQIVMVILIWQLAKEVWSEAVADRGLLLFLFGPGAVAFGLIYSEAMLFAAAAACLLALRRRWWVVAGLSAAVGTAVRPVGIALVACCAWEAISVIRSERQWRPLLAPLLSPLGVISWAAYLWAYTGNPFIWSKAEKAWNDTFDPFNLIKRVFFHELAKQGLLQGRILPVAGALFALGALVLLLKARAPASLVVYSTVVVAISASSRVVGLRPRLIETAFPLVLILGYWLKDEIYSIVLAFAGVTLGCYFMLILTTPQFIP
jgi:hypothetical protein